MKKRMIALLLGTVLLLCLFTGCVSKNQIPQTEQSAQTNEHAKTDGADLAEKEEMPVALRLVMFGDLSPRREEYFKTDFHDAVLRDLNIDLTVEFLPWSSKDVLQTMLITGEKIAVNNTVAFTDWAQKGLCAEIPMDLIEENCPNLLAMRGQYGFSGCTFNDNIYIIPFGNKAYSGTGEFYTVREDILDEIGMKASDITTIDQLLECFEAVKNAYPGMRVYMGGDAGGSDPTNTLLGHEFIGQVTTTSRKNGVYVNEQEDNDNVYNYYESELFKKCSQFNALLIEKGYALPDHFTDPGQGLADWNAGNCFARYGVAGQIIEASFISAIPNAKITRIKIGNRPGVIDRDYDWGMSISAADAEHVEDWLRLFDWMYKDQQTYDFLIYGVEGKDYERDANGNIQKLSTDVFWEDWFLMAKCYMTYDPSISQDKIDMYEHTDDGAIMSKLAGFTFDSAPVSTEMDMLAAAISEYMEPIYRGIVDYDENYDNAIAELKKAGLDTIIAEYQAQFSEFYHENH